MLVAEADMLMHKIANRLDAKPTGCGLPEQCPSGLGQPIGLAVAAPEQIHECLGRQVFHGALRRSELIDRIRQSAIVDERVGSDSGVARWRDDSAAPVTETVAVGRRSGLVGW